MKADGPCLRGERAARCGDQGTWRTRCGLRCARRRLRCFASPSLLLDVSSTSCVRCSRLENAVQSTPDSSSFAWAAGRPSYAAVGPRPSASIGELSSSRARLRARPSRARRLRSGSPLLASSSSPENQIDKLYCIILSGCRIKIAARAHRCCQDTCVLGVSSIQLQIPRCHLHVMS